jgi:hypothetical protein
VIMKHLSLENKDLIHVVDQLDFCLLVNGQGSFNSLYIVLYSIYLLGLGLNQIMQIQFHLRGLC